MSVLPKLRPDTRSPVPVCQSFTSKQAAINKYLLCFRCEVAENCALLGCYTASSGNLLPTLQDNISVPSSAVKNPKGIGLLTPEDGTGMLFQNVANKLPLLAV
jgi:hypothetical protein